MTFLEAYSSLHERKTHYEAFAFAMPKNGVRLRFWVAGAYAATNAEGTEITTRPCKVMVAPRVRDSFIFCGEAIQITSDYLLANWIVMETEIAGTVTKEGVWVCVKPKTEPT